MGTSAAICTGRRGAAARAIAPDAAPGSAMRVAEKQAPCSGETLFDDDTGSVRLDSDMALVKVKDRAQITLPPLRERRDLDWVIQRLLDAAELLYRRSEQGICALF